MSLQTKLAGTKMDFRIDSFEKLASHFFQTI